MEYKVRPSTKEDIIDRIFENRNINIEDKDSFLYPTEESISNPCIYDNMEEGYNLLKKHIDSNGLIMILIDADADGYCSSATLVNYLRLTLGYTNIKYVTHTLKKHGLTSEIMKKVKQIQPQLLIIPDAGTNDNKEHKILKDMGIDILIIDHHELEGELSENAVIINNQISENGNKTLCGGGMVLKFLEYIDIKLGINQSQFYRDLVAVSLVADGMLTIEVETRFYISEGLKNINNPFLKELTKGIKPNSNIFTMIGFQISPAINAIIRMGCMQDKISLFESMICENRMELIKIRGKGEVELPLTEYILKISDRLKTKQTKEISRILEDEGTVIIHNNYPIVFLMHTDESAQPLSGLIASKLVDIYGKPALVLRGTADSKGEVYYRGSARSTESVPNLKDYLINTGKFMFCEGHQGAFGVMLSSKQLQELFTELMYRTLPKNPCYVVDKVYDEYVSTYDISQVNDLKGQWSKGFDEPKFLIRLKDVRSTDISVIGEKKNTLKIVHDYITFLKFKCSEEEIEEFTTEGYKNIDIIGTFNINVWKNKTTPQVFIEDYEIVSSKPFDNAEFYNYFTI